MAKRTHFVRVLQRDQVNELIDQLSETADKKFDHVKSRQDSFDIKAPDGDTVFAGLIHSNRKYYLCRLHREVFDDGMS